MGNCSEKVAETAPYLSSNSSKENDSTNWQIEKQLENDHKKKAKIVKLLLLGPAESGKSTILKQMKIIHQEGYSKHELLSQRKLVYLNVVDAMAQLLNGCRKLQMSLHPDRELDAALIYEIVNKSIEMNTMPEEIHWTIKRLWKDAIVQEAYNRRKEFYLIESGKYFIESVDRIADPNYIPTIQDVLLSRVVTIGVCEIVYTYKKMEFHVFDVGGQKSQRKKWIHLFDNVDAILFLAAMSEYDQVMAEDGETNRLRDALSLFKWIANHQAFSTVEIILFLNKKDVFEEKIQRIPLQVCFPSYKYKNDFKNGSLYIQKKFEAQVEDHQKTIYTHMTCATNTDNIQFIMESVCNMILEKKLKETGIV